MSVSERGKWRRHNALVDKAYSQREVQSIAWVLGGDGFMSLYAGDWSQAPRCDELACVAEQLIAEARGLA